MSTMQNLKNKNAFYPFKNYNRSFSTQSYLGSFSQYALYNLSENANQKIYSAYSNNVF